VSDPVQSQLVTDRSACRSSCAAAGTLRQRYEEGASIRMLAEGTSYSNTLVHGLLASAGTSIRSRGRSASVAGDKVTPGQASAYIMHM
jgi:hypothetical protein